MEGIAPRTGAWIETLSMVLVLAMMHIAPRTGAWIETLTAAPGGVISVIAPRTGAWIETMIYLYYQVIPDRPPHGGVD